MDPFMNFFTSSPDRRHLRRGFSLLLLVGLIPGACSHQTDTHPAPPLPAVEVHSAEVTETTIPVYLEAVGTVQPHRMASVSAKVTGRVLRMLAIPGRAVKEGETLAEIDAGDLRASAERAEAALNQARQDLERTRQLLAKGATTAAESDRVVAAERMAAATLAEVKASLDQAIVTAPFSGTVSRKLADSGDLATPGRALFTVEDGSLLRLEVPVPESLAGGLKLGQSLRVKVSGVDSDLSAAISEIAPAADVASRTFLIKLDLPKEDSLRAGQFGRAYLPRDERQALYVKSSALVSRGQMDYLFVVDPEGPVARLRIVRSAAEDGGKVEILGGVNSGERVVTDPPSDLLDGQPVTLLN